MAKAPKLTDIERHRGLESIEWLYFSSKHNPSNARIIDTWKGKESKWNSATPKSANFVEGLKMSDVLQRFPRSDSFFDVLLKLSFGEDERMYKKKKEVYKKWMELGILDWLEFNEKRAFEDEKDNTSGKSGSFGAIAGNRYTGMW